MDGTVSKNKEDSQDSLEVEVQKAPQRDAARQETPAGPVRPFRPFRSYLQEFFNKQVLAILFTCVACTAATVYLVETKDLNRMFAPGEPWKGLVVGNVVLIMVVLMAQGLRAEFAMMAAVAFFGLLGIVTTRQALSGMASEGNFTCQCFFVLVRGVQDVGVLDWIFNKILGRPRGRRFALVRAQGFAACISAFMSGGPPVLAGCPALATWAPQVGLTSREVQLPFAFSTAFGQALLLTSSPVSLLVADKMKEAHLRIYDPALLAVILAFITGLYGTFAADMLRKKGNTAIATTEAPDRIVFEGKYVLSFYVQPDSLLCGRTPTESGLLSFPGAILLDSESLADRPICPKDMLRFAATATGLAHTRKRGYGLTLHDFKSRSTLDNLGGNRHQRRLYELGLHSGSSHIGKCLPLKLPKAQVLAARRPCRTNGDAEQGGQAFIGPLQTGDVLLVEAFEDFASVAEVHENFGSVSVVPDSAPPRHGRRVDTCRGWLAWVLLLGTVMLAACNVAGIAFLALSAVVVAVALNVIHRHSALAAFSLPLYLIIAGGIGVGEAMASSGLANALARSMVNLSGMVPTDSPIVILVAITFICMMLSNVMSSTACASLLVPVTTEICMSQGIDQKAVALLVIFGCNCAFATPFATVMNLSVKDWGPYDFMDYVRFGMPLQFIHLVTIPCLCYAYMVYTADPSSSPFEGVEGHHLA